ncbi:clan AA aspartic protease, TIGR02281 family [Asticcacaulis biprosthecium C19]|uniref:Clan AA aspartic protease, TIGR02281 family n=1 Tax=Asticcacaulis biprosthecium C19 TaxID=715226 RepID=F4QPJ9_9CAUL|nr:TIGR02281 family clan AA aspartic protease [Asticcacaulis biprosthecium]EGF91257.1 clan AA aspartic protease, TIGR02281 family [Asticcacaulis biprosthecium C19]
MYKSAIIVGSAVFCAVMAGMGILSLHEQEKASKDVSAQASVPQAAVVQAELSSESASGHTTAIPKAKDGHFWANASVNSTAVRFLVDTGASQVVLTPSDAQRLGFTPNNLVYDRKVITANGPSFAAMVELKSVGVGTSTVRNVEALVVREGLHTSLLGMSYLGRLSRFEATRTSLILHP